MDAFEQVVGEIFSHLGYWIIPSFKVELTKTDKEAIKRKTTPRWELDIIAYQGASNNIQVIECKSYLDSNGVKAKDLEPQPAGSKSRYKLFVEPDLRQVIFNRLGHQLTKAGLCRANPTFSLALVCGKVYERQGKQDRQRLFDLSDEYDWTLYDERWLNLQLLRLAEAGYQNQTSSVVAKLFARGATVNNYAHIAIKTVERITENEGNPSRAWAFCAKQIFPNQPESVNKPCPKNAFLGLCEAGYVRGIPSGDYTRSINNKAYAIAATSLLFDNPRLARDPDELWRQTLRQLGEDESKTPNQQMHVVIALYDLGYLIRP